MKDNTAAVHVQVPVEVTSFLLNEKRTEITKIELKQRVTVLLVPNKHLDTPNYKLERLRHDDPRLENLQASYTMIEEPDDEVGITRREKAKPKQEPVIKGVLPDQPAPPAAAAGPRRRRWPPRRGLRCRPRLRAAEPRRRRRLLRLGEEALRRQQPGPARRWRTGARPPRRQRAEAARPRPRRPRRAR